MQVQELVGIVPWNFIATICNLFIQVYLIKRFLFKPINEMLDKRKAKADAEIQDAVLAYSRRIASSFVSNCSRYTSSTGLLDLVYFAPFPALCASRRFSISFVHPVYNVSSLHFKIYV